MPRRTLALLALLATTLAGCGGSAGAAGETVTVVVSAPLSTSPWVGQFVQRGAELAVAEVNAAGGVETPAGARMLRLEVLDNAGSPQTAAANARQAVADGAVALVTDGVGAQAVAAVTDPAQLPVFLVFDGSESAIDPAVRPSLYRMAPANRPMARRLADYISGKVRAVAVVTDDTTYGRDGRASVLDALGRNEIAVVGDEVVPSGARDVSAQVRRARSAGADHLVVWAGAQEVVAVLRAARSAGWDVPVYTGPTGEDPLVRQQLADHPEWLGGLTFVSFRITSEVGAGPFSDYRTQFEARFGAEKVGVSQGGKDVVMPPDWSMYSYDTVKLVAQALAASNGALGAPFLTALHRTVITGANGDERGFSATDREGVSPDDMYFGRFDGFVFTPVTDDILSTNLPPIPQT